MKEWLRKKFVSWLVGDLQKIATAYDLVEIHTDRENLKQYFVFRDNPLTPEQETEFIQSADQFSKSFLWKVIKSQLRYDAQKMVFIDGTFGKAALWLLEGFEKYLETIGNAGKEGSPEP